MARPYCVLYRQHKIIWRVSSCLLYLCVIAEFNSTRTRRWVEQITGKLFPNWQEHWRIWYLLGLKWENISHKGVEICQCSWENFSLIDIVIFFLLKWTKYLKLNWYLFQPNIAFGLRVFWHALNVHACMYLNLRRIHSFSMHNNSITYLFSKSRWQSWSEGPKSEDNEDTSGREGTFDRCVIDEFHPPVLTLNLDKDWPKSCGLFSQMPNHDNRTYIQYSLRHFCNPHVV